MVELGGVGCFCSRLLIISAILVLLPSGSLQGKHERRLLDKVLKDYNKYERPVLNDSDPLTVQLGMTLQQIIDLDEKNQILTVNVWMRVYWLDAYMAWDPKEYGNITDIRVPPSEIWIPDILLYNSADERFDGTYPSNVLISSDGLCQYIPPGILSSTCKIDIEYFPFDEQMCQMKFGSWTYNGFKLDLQKLYEEGDISTFTTNGEWDLIGVPVVRSEFTYPCCPEPYPDISFYIHIRRRTLYYGFNMIIPCALMTVMAITGFTLPPDSGEKLTLGITILLSMTVFLLLIAETMPPTSEVIPLVAKYYGSTMLIVGLSVVMTIVGLNFHYRHPDNSDMSNTTRAIFLDWLPWLMRMKRPGKSNSKPKIRRHAHSAYDPVKAIDLEMNDIRLRTPPRIENRERMMYRRYKCNQTLEESKPMVMNEPICNGHVTPVKSQSSEAILKELKFLSEHFRKEEKHAEVMSEWHYACLVVDRLCLYLFLVGTTVSSFVIIFIAPNAREDLIKSL
ncbi:neuronal acetylcholine receptor subunit alpha-7-like [Saccoglossus kowalevskii]